MLLWAEVVGMVLDGWTFLWVDFLWVKGWSCPVCWGDWGDFLFSSLGLICYLLSTLAFLFCWG